MRASVVEEQPTKEAASRNPRAPRPPAFLTTRAADPYPHRAGGLRVPGRFRRAPALRRTPSTSVGPPVPAGRRGLRRWEECRGVPTGRPWLRCRRHRHGLPHGCRVAQPPWAQLQPDEGRERRLGRPARCPAALDRLGNRVGLGQSARCLARDDIDPAFDEGEHRLEASGAASCDSVFGGINEPSTMAWRSSSGFDGSNPGQIFKFRRVDADAAREVGDRADQVKSQPPGAAEQAVASSRTAR